MKTSVIEVHDMLSVLSVTGVEKRIGEVAGVESVTVNFAAGNATVRYDETRLDIADIKSDVRQAGYKADAPAAASTGDAHEEHKKAPDAPKTPPVAPVSAAPKSVLDAAPASDKQQDKAASDKVPSTPASAEPKAAAGSGHEGHAAMDKKAG
jgi:Cu2+-exporting ATPase